MSFSELYSMSYHGLNLESPDSTDFIFIALYKFFESLILKHLSLDYA